MFGFLRDLAHSLREKGLRALASEIPVAGALVDIVADALQRRRARHEKAELREDIEVIARIASRDEAKNVAKEIAREVAGGEPLEIQLQLENYLTQVPQALRQSLRRPEDPSGKTVGARFDESPELIAQMLPQRLPRFQASDKPDCLRGEWVLEELLGTGGFGEVWKARHADFDGTVAAIKFCLDPTAQDRLLKHEGQLSSQVMRQGSHPGIVPLQDASLRSNPPWLRYEYIPGGDLLLLFNKLKPLSIAHRLKTALPFFKKICEAVGHCHRLNPSVVHRDLKPPNILLQKLARGYSIRIADFGISQLAANHRLEPLNAAIPNLSIAKTLQGAHTPIYSSPQQVAGEPADVRDDVYSLGVIFYQLLMADSMAARPGGDWEDELREAGIAEGVIKLIGSCVSDRVERRPDDAQLIVDKLPRNDKPSLDRLPTEHNYPRELERTRELAVVHDYESAVAILETLPAHFHNPGELDEYRRKRDGIRILLAKIRKGAAESPQPKDHLFVWSKGLLSIQPNNSEVLAVLDDLLPPGIGSRFTNEIGMEFTWIPTGMFKMGSPAGVGLDDERPLRDVSVSGFFMGVCPVTQEQWKKVMGDNPSRFKTSPTNPVEKVSWDDCQQFLIKLREIDGWSYRLPSEAEWEHACRAGTNWLYFFGGNDSQLSEYAWNDRNARRSTHPIGLKRRNPWGLHDILGNVWEWCADWYGPYGQAPVDGTAQAELQSQDARVLRGGSWNHASAQCRCAYRFRLRQNIDRDYIGVRVCFGLGS